MTNREAQPFSYNVSALTPQVLELPPDEEAELSRFTEEVIDLAFLQHSYKETIATESPIDIIDTTAPNDTFRSLMPNRTNRLAYNKLTLEYDCERDDTEGRLLSARICYFSDDTPDIAELYLYGDEYDRHDGHDILRTVADSQDEEITLDQAARLQMLDATLELAVPHLAVMYPNMTILEKLQSIAFSSSKTSYSRSGTYAIEPPEGISDGGGGVGIEIHDESFFLLDGTRKHTEHSAHISVVQSFFDGESSAKTDFTITAVDQKIESTFGLQYEYSLPATRDYLKLKMSTFDQYNEVGYEYPTKFTENIKTGLSRLLMAPDKVRVRRLLD